MATLNQRLRLKTKFAALRKKKKDKNVKTKALNRCPQRKGYCLRVFTITPKKPNSAVRKVARVGLTNMARVTAYIPGELHSVTKHGVVMVRGGKTQDLPGVQYKIIRGKYDVTPVALRRTKRSKYGRKKPTPTPTA